MSINIATVTKLQQRLPQTDVPVISQILSELKYTEYKCLLIQDHSQTTKITVKYNYKYNGQITDDSTWGAGVPTENLPPTQRSPPKSCFA